MTEAPLEVLAVSSGEVWICHDIGEPIRLRPGDVAITHGPDHYKIGATPDSEPGIEIHPGQLCRTLDGEPLFEEMSLGVRSWGNDSDGDTMMLVGAYHHFGEIGERLVRALPPVIHLTPDRWDNTLVSILAEEMTKDDPGQAAVLDRLVDLVVVSVLRTWFDRPEAQPPAWYRAQSDPVVGTAIRLMQNRPAEEWTVARLASEANVSRANLAKRFTQLVGEPPMSFLTSWRIDLAADLLRDPEATVTAVAQRVGYSTPFALSTAFKRVRGISPQQHRDLVVA